LESLSTALTSGRLGAVRLFMCTGYDSLRPHLQACEKLPSPIGSCKKHVHTARCCREIASEPNILTGDGVAYQKSGAHSTLMLRLPALYLLLSYLLLSLLPLCLSPPVACRLTIPDRPSLDRCPAHRARRPAHLARRPRPAHLMRIMKQHARTT